MKLLKMIPFCLVVSLICQNLHAEVNFSDIGLSGVTIRGIDGLVVDRETGETVVGMTYHQAQKACETKGRLPEIGELAEMFGINPYYKKRGGDCRDEHFIAELGTGVMCYTRIPLVEYKGYWFWSASLHYADPANQAYGYYPGFGSIDARKFEYLDRHANGAARCVVLHL